MSKMVKYNKDELIRYEIYKLVDFYDPILRKPTKPVKLETLEDMKNAEYIMHSMAETMKSLGGLGLSANQVGLEHRVCTVDMGDDIWVMFNPEIIDSSLVNQSQYAEGCLSYPGLYLKIPRPERITVRFQAVGGQFVEQEFAGLTAVCVQHEIDHLDGIVYTEKVSPIKLDQAKRKVKQNLKKIKRIVMPTPVETPATQPVELPKIEIQDPINSEKKTPSTFVYTT